VARPTFSELLDLDVPMAMAVMDSCPPLDDGTKAADMALGRLFRGLSSLRR